MSSKRPPVDLAALTSGPAVPMAEAVQRGPVPPAAKAAPVAMPGATTKATGKTTELANLGFKVPPAFRKRFLVSAANANLKLNELLFAAYEAWEKQDGEKR
jgi:hypothetical protein